MLLLYFYYRRQIYYESNKNSFPGYGGFGPSLGLGTSLRVRPKPGGGEDIGTVSDSHSSGGANYPSASFDNPASAAGGDHAVHISGKDLNTALILSKYLQQRSYFLVNLAVGKRREKYYQKIC